MMNMKPLQHFFAAVLLANGAATPVTAAPGAGDKADIQARVAAARQTAAEFIRELGGTLKKEMQAGGPVAAMNVCRNAAPRIANRLSLEKGWKVTRVGTRVRNPMLGIPDAWEQKVLKSFEARAAKGEKFRDMAYFEVVEEPAGKSLRFMKAIGVKPQCMVCHGPAEQIADPIRKQLESLYPHDRAVGYQVGDLRGAVSIKQPLEN
jgi:hypothetical protein